MTLSDRIAVMANGRVMQLDSPNGLYESPNSQDVASFIGTMNFFDGVVKEHQGPNLTIDAQGIGTVAANTRNGPFQTGDKVQVAIRPEKLKLTAEKPEGATYSAQAKVENMAYLGERSHYYIEIGGNVKPVAVSSQNEAVGGGGPSEAETVWLSWDDGAVVVLDAG